VVRGRNSKGMKCPEVADKGGVNLCLKNRAKANFSRKNRTNSKRKSTILREENRVRTIGKK